MKALLMICSDNIAYGILSFLRIKNENVTLCNDLINKSTAKS